MRRFCLALLLWCAASTVGAAGLSLVFAGDTTLEDAPGALIERGGDPQAKVAHLFQGADIRLVNLECVVSTIGVDFRAILTPAFHPILTPPVWV